MRVLLLHRRRIIICNYMHPAYSPAAFHIFSFLRLQLQQKMISSVTSVLTTLQFGVLQSIVISEDCREKLWALPNCKTYTVFLGVPPVPEHDFGIYGFVGSASFLTDEVEIQILDRLAHEQNFRRALRENYLLLWSFETPPMQRRKQCISTSYIKSIIDVKTK